MIHFRLVPHALLPGVEIVEIWRDKELVGAIYPDQPSSLLINSFYLECVGYESKSAGKKDPGSCRVLFGKRRDT